MIFISAALFSTTWATTQAAPNNTAEAQTVATPTPPPYGDNPNIFRVLAHKTKESVQDTAHKVGDSTEKGIEKVKPKVDQAWDAVTGKNTSTVAVPIERKSLSESSSNNTAPTPTKQPSAEALPSSGQPETKALATEPTIAPAVPAALIQPAMVKPIQPATVQPAPPVIVKPAQPAPVATPQVESTQPTVTPDETIYL